MDAHVITVNRYSLVYRVKGRYGPNRDGSWYMLCDSHVDPIPCYKITVNRYTQFIGL